MGSPEAAVAAYNEAVKLAPTRARSHFQLGKAYHYMEFLQEAIASYQRAIQINSRFTSAYYYLGLAFRDSGDVRRALQAFQTVLEIDPFHTEARLGYCHMLYIKQNTVAAEACLLNVLEIAPNSAAASVLAGLIHLKKKNHKKSLAYFRSALTVTPNNPTARYMSSALIGKESNDEWRLLYLTEYYDLHAYHYENTVSRVLKSEVYHIIRRAVQDYLPGACHQDTRSVSSHQHMRGNDGRRSIIGGGGDSGCEDCGGVCTGERCPADIFSESGVAKSELNSEHDKEVVDASWDDEDGDRVGEEHDRGRGQYEEGEGYGKSLYMLDLGSGSGLLCDAFMNHTSTRHVEMIGADISSRMNAKAVQKACYKEVLNVDMTLLLSELMDSEFDVVTAVDTLHHMGDLEGVLRSVRGILRSEGLFIFTVEVMEREESAQQPSPSSTSSRAAQAFSPSAPTNVSSNVTQSAIRETSKVLENNVESPQQQPSSLTSGAFANSREFMITPTGGYVHQRSYLTRLAMKNNFELVLQQNVKLPRFDLEGHLAPGVLFVLRAN
jgi:predicted TPR repeat methyltransferase